MEEEETNHNAQKATRESQKVVWIITYGASGPFITIEMLSSLGRIQADECHSTTDLCMKYTYIHLTKRVRQTSIDKFMAKAKDAHGIILNEIFGYDAIAGNGRNLKVEDHVGFKMLVKHYKEKNSSFSPCTDGEPVLKRGQILQSAAINHDKPKMALESQSKARVIEYTKKLEEKVEAFKRQKTEDEATNAVISEERRSLREENAILRHRVQELERVLLLN
jgi:hypothetical protein